MGGGAGGAIRAAAKVAGIGATFSGAIRGGGAAETLAVRRSLTEQVGGVKADQLAVQRPAWEIDDWEFAGVGSETEELVVDKVASPVKPRVVFGPVPSIEEAREATSELKDALEKVYLSSPKSSDSVDSSSSLRETKACITHESSAPKSAIQAFMFLKESPAAQNVVASIACDPNVWNAVMQNPSLMEYLEAEKKCAVFDVNESPKSSASNSDAEEVAKPDGLMAIIEDVKLTVLDMVNGLSKFVQNLFADPDEEKKSEGMDGTSRSFFAGGTFMALAMMVIMVVVMKRG